MATQAVEQADPFLTGNFAPVLDELDAGELAVTGEGAYHWFDGDGMIHAVDLEDGRARYKNRFVRTFEFEFEFEREAGRARVPGV